MRTLQNYIEEEVNKINNKFFINDLEIINLIRQSLHRIAKITASELKDIPSRCRLCEKNGFNPYGECECSYEDKGYIKKSDLQTKIKEFIK